MKALVIVIIVFVTVACFVAAGIIAISSNLFHDGIIINFLNGEAKKMNVNMNKPLDISGVEKIKVYMQAGDATIHPSDNAQAVLSGFVIGSPEKLQFDVQKNGAELEITVKQIRSIVNFSIGEIALDVGLPAGFNGMLEVNGATSKISVGAFNLNTLTSKLTTGALQVDAVAKEMDLESTTGSVTINGNSRNFGIITIHTTTGSINAEKMTLQKISSRSTTGKICLTDIAAGQITAEATTGKIEILNCEGSVDARAMTGSIEASLSNVLNSFYETTTGKITLILPKGSAFNLDARTTTGSINTSFTFLGEVTGEKRFSAGAEIKGQTNGGGAEVKVRTTTGGIDINAK